MDDYDDVRQNEFHPSHSIPNAAYPDDSPYRPGTGGAGIAQHQQQQQHQASYGVSAIVSGTTTTATPSSNNSHPAAWPPFDIPSSPPPPYDPRQAPSTYTPFNPAAASHQLSHSTDGRAPEMIPLQPLQTSISHPPQQQGEPATLSSAVTQDNSQLEGGKSDDSTGEHKRKHKRLRLCVILMATMFIFGGALILGIALGLLKTLHHNNSKPNDDYI